MNRESAYDEKPTELTDALEHGEGQFVAFVGVKRRGARYEGKPISAKTLAKNVAKAAAALANADGGTVLVGIERDGFISGLPYREAEIVSFQNAPFDLLDPPLHVASRVLTTHGLQILELRVTPSPVPHLLSGAECYLRTGAQTVPLDRERVTLLKQGKERIFYERQFAPGATFDDLDSDLLEMFCQKLDDPREPAQMLRERYSLVEYQRRTFQLTNAALLLFARQIGRWHPRSCVDFVKYEGTQPEHGANLNVVKRVRMEGPILDLIEEAIDTIRHHIKERMVLHDLFFTERFEYPPFAWQEALINGIAHRDYGLTGASVEVWMFDDHLEIRSPGRLPEPITLEQLYRREHVHFSRNPLIVRVLTDLGYMRELGEGIPRIFDEMEQNYLEAPVLREEGFTFIISLKNTSIFDPETQAWMDRFRDYQLNWRQRRILAHAWHHGMSFTSHMYQDIGRVDRDTAYREIQELVKQGVAKADPKRRSRYQVIAPEPSPRPRRKKTE